MKTAEMDRMRETTKNNGLRILAIVIASGGNCTRGHVATIWQRVTPYWWLTNGELTDAIKWLQHRGSVKVDVLPDHCWDSMHNTITSLQ